MSETYLKVILISAVGGLYMIAYSLFYIGARIVGVGQVNPKYYFIHQAAYEPGVSATCTGNDTDSHS